MSSEGFGNQVDRHAAIMIVRNCLFRLSLMVLSGTFGGASSGFFADHAFKGQIENAGNFLQPTAMAIGQSVI
ncbi:hypothetical protein J7E62_07600 [Variovorax paradoxus]|nr:hypothetical protein [Variovorax paradoxus]